MNGSTTRKIAIGVAIAVFAGLILAGVRSCRWMRDTLIRMEERQKK